MNNNDAPFRDVLGNGGGPPPGAEELRGIVARAGRHHRRMAALGMAVALAAGAASGYLIAGRPSGPTRAAAGGPAPAGVGAAGASAAPSAKIVNGGYFSDGAAATGGPPQYTALFARAAGQVSIRAFLTNYPQSVGAPARSPADCVPLGPPQFQAELSTPKMVGEVVGLVASDRSKALSVVATAILGQQEGDPTVAVVVATGPAVAAVRMTFTGGAADHMTPVQGWVTLAAGVPVPPTSPTVALGTLAALDGSGRVMATQTVTVADQGTPFGQGCAMPCAPEPTTTQISNASGSTTAAKSQTNVTGTGSPTTPYTAVTGAGSPAASSSSCMVRPVTASPAQAGPVPTMSPGIATTVAPASAPSPTSVPGH